MADEEDEDEGEDDEDGDGGEVADTANIVHNSKPTTSSTDDLAVHIRRQPSRELQTNKRTGFSLRHSYFDSLSCTHS